MELTLNQVATFSPSIERIQSSNIEPNIPLRTAKISPSDLPNEVIVRKNANSLIYSFDYTLMEYKNDIYTYNSENFQFQYSKITGRLYMVKFSIDSSIDFFKTIKEERKQFEKKRLRDNFKFGCDFVITVFEQIRKMEKINANSSEFH